MSESKRNTMNRNAINFTLYSYFNISLCDIKSKDDFIQAAVAKAYDDATLMRAYKYNVEDKTSSNKAKDDSIEYLVKQGMIENLIESKSENDFNGKHSDICRRLVILHEKVKDKNGNACFTYGNAQKWVNMTTKNLYVMAGLCSQWMNDELSEFCETILVCSGNFHAPIDQIVLRALINPRIVQDTRMNNYVYSKGEGIACYESNGIFRLGHKGDTGIKKVPWSRMGSYEFYNDFRNEIKKIIPNGLSPIEWECEAWIKQNQEDEKHTQIIKSASS